MPQIQSAKKRVRVAARQAEENRLHRSRSRTALKSVQELVAAGKIKDAAAEVARTQSYLDKTAKGNALHKNTVARYKSRLAAALKAAGNKDAIPKRSPVVAKAAPAKKPATKKPAAKAAPDKKPAKKPAKTEPKS